MNFRDAKHATALPSPASQRGISAGERGLRILLVEDHEDTRNAMQRLLTRWGHSVWCAEGVARAVEIASAHDFDLLLSDLGLPDGTGAELLERLHEHSLSPLHAVAMSGHGEERDFSMTRRAGFEEHLVKPVAMDRLREIIRRIGRL